MEIKPFTASLALALAVPVWSGCAETAAPAPAPEEIAVVLNSTAATLSLLPVVAPPQVSTIPLGASDVQPVSVTARGGTAVVPLRGRDAIAVVDLRAGQLVSTVQLETGAGVAGAAMVNDSIV